MTSSIFSQQKETSLIYVRQEEQIMFKEQVAKKFFFRAILFGSIDFCAYCQSECHQNEDYCGRLYNIPMKHSRATQMHNIKLEHITIYYFS